MLKGHLELKWLYMVRVMIHLHLIWDVQENPYLIGHPHERRRVVEVALHGPLLCHNLIWS
jgi:hypothetical protein